MQELGQITHNHSKAHYGVLIHGLLFAALLLLFSITVFFWPIPRLGFGISPWTHNVTAVDPGGSADQAGIMVGDHVIAAYGGHMWGDLLRSSNILALTPPLTAPIDFTIERNGEQSTVQVWQQAPAASFQVKKGLRFALAFICWLTGYTILILRRHQATGSQAIALFWMCLSAILGSLLYASFTSPYFHVLLYWLLVGILAPMCPLLFANFPPQYRSPTQHHTYNVTLLLTWISINGALVMWIYIVKASIFDLVLLLSSTTAYLWLLVFLIVGAQLRRRYKKERIEHARRQIRIIASACIIAGAVWLLASGVKNVLGYPWLAIDYIVELTPLIIPIAFLIAYTVTDLYHFDDVARRVAGITLALTATMVNMYVFIRIVPINTSAMAIAVPIYGITFYRPTSHLFKRIIPILSFDHKEKTSIEQSIRKLTTTLEPNQLTHIIADGIDQAFGAPGFALYIIQPSEPEIAHLGERSSIKDVPQTVGGTALYQMLIAESRQILESRSVFNTLGTSTLTDEEHQLVNHPSISLWCPLVNADNQLLAFIILGMRSDLEPYRTRDFHLLQRLQDAASLALANSATYIQHKEAAELIRQLLQALKQSQDKTAAAIARQLHDEIINVSILLNIRSLETIVAAIEDPSLRQDIQDVIKGEQSIATALRTICKRLEPTALNDKYGLSAIIRSQIQRIQPLWTGECQLSIENDIRPLQPQFQQEVMRIVQEALSNIIKHTSATKARVQVIYPHDMDEQFQVIITDNDPEAKPIKPVSGHFGFHNMRESARAIEGTIRFELPPGGGHRVLLSAPLPPNSMTTMEEEYLAYGT